ncbi:MAG: clostripain-related cysteine peptidase [Candidatus Sericytochromatia bacterium]
MKKATLVASAASVLAGLVACGPTSPLPGAQFARPGANVGTFNNGAAVRNGKKWTIAIYLAADNNLYSAGKKDLTEIKAGLAKNPAAAQMVDVIVLFDGLPKGDSQLLRMTPAGQPDEVINDNGAVIPASKEVDTGDPQVFKNFVNFTTKNFPGQNNSISVWNHGSGLDVRTQAGASFFDIIGGGESGQRTRGVQSKAFASDDQSGNHLMLADLNPALALANQNLGKAVDIFGFDTCLMQHVEVAYQIKGQANILVASEELEPGDGWYYTDYIGAVAQNPDLTPPQLAKAMVDTYVKSYLPGGPQRGNDITLAALDINSVERNLVPALNNFAAAMQSSLATEKAAINAARMKTQVFYNRNAADLGDFLRKYASTSRNPRVSSAAAQLDQAMKQTLIAEGHSNGKMAGATGFQVYFPTATMTYNRRYDDASYIRFAETQGWGNFLKAFTAK